MPKVTGGLLDEPYPIRTKGDVNRALVLPRPRPTSDERLERRVAPKAPAKKAAPADEQPKGGFDYVRKRNRMMRGVSSRARRSNGSRRA